MLHLVALHRLCQQQVWQLPPLQWVSVKVSLRRWVVLQMLSAQSVPRLAQHCKALPMSCSRLVHQSAQLHKVSGTVSSQRLKVFQKSLNQWVVLLGRSLMDCLMCSTQSVRLLRKQGLGSISLLMAWLRLPTLILETWLHLLQQ